MPQMERIANMFMDRIAELQGTQQRMIETLLRTGGVPSSLSSSPLAALADAPAPSRRLAARRLPTIAFDDVRPPASASVVAVAACEPRPVVPMALAAPDLADSSLGVDDSASQATAEQQQPAPVAPNILDMMSALDDREAAKKEEKKKAKAEARLADASPQPCKKAKVEASPKSTVKAKGKAKPKAKGSPKVRITIKLNLSSHLTKSYSKFYYYLRLLTYFMLLLVTCIWR